MSLGPWQIILIVVLVVLLFGRGKISELMSDVAKGIKSFKKGISEDEAPKDPKVISADATSAEARDREKTQAS
ncbi:MAG: twin-arginine translocase TatA/TatE family subunit [Rhizobiales bacterium]|nr:twin-arginine translocase TatA/TatE family subunit [Hyphomicrobiales bacterium]